MKKIPKSLVGSCEHKPPGTLADSNTSERWKHLEVSNQLTQKGIEVFYWLEIGALSQRLLVRYPLL